MFPGQREKQVSPKPEYLLQDFLLLPSKGTSSSTPSPAPWDDGNGVCLLLAACGHRWGKQQIHAAEPRIVLREHTSLCARHCFPTADFGSSSCLPSLSAVSGKAAQRDKHSSGGAGTGTSSGKLLKGLGNLSLQNAVADCLQPPWVVLSPAESR